MDFGIDEAVRWSFFSYLAPEDIRYVHDASLEILEEAGLLVRNEKARKRFAEHGAQVDHETEIVPHSRLRCGGTAGPWCRQR